MKPQKRWLVGKKIADVKWRTFDDGREGEATDPLITLSDGSSIEFVVQETDVGCYGVAVIYHPVRK